MLLLINLYIYNIYNIYIYNMKWYILGILSSLFFGTQSTITYKLIDVEKLGPSAVNNIVHLIFAVFGLAFVYIFNETKIIKSIYEIINNYKVLTIIAGVGALIGNILLYWSYELGKDINPGIITTISNSDIIISTLLAYIVYNKKISTAQIFGIIIMLIALTMAAMGNSLFGMKEPKTLKSSMKTKENKKNKPTNFDWIIIALLSAIAYGALSFSQYIITQKSPNLNMIALTIMIALVETICGFIIYFAAYISSITNLIEKGPFKNYRLDTNKLLSIKYILYTASAAFCDGFGLITLLRSYKTAPNPGISDSISDSYSFVQAILTWIIFNKQMDQIQIVSIFIF